MLSFSRTALHPFAPTRHPATLHSFNLYTPCQIHLLPGQRVTVDFLLTVDLPEGHRGEIRLKPLDRKLRLHAETLCEFVVVAAAVPPLTLSLPQTARDARRTWWPPSRTTTTS